MAETLMPRAAQLASGRWIALNLDGQIPNPPAVDPGGFSTARIFRDGGGGYGGRRG